MQQSSTRSSSVRIFSTDYARGHSQYSTAVGSVDVCSRIVIIRNLKGTKTQIESSGSRYTDVLRGPGRVSGGTRSNIWNRLGVRLRPAFWMVKAEMIETVLYGCVT